jgi:DNA repair protein RecN (Recombination protein N)
LAETQKLLRELEKLDPAMATVVNIHETAVIELSDIARDLGRYTENLDLDPEQLTALDQRVSLFESLKRKYGATIPDVIAFGQRAAQRMRKIEGRDEELQRLASEIATHRAESRKAGETLRKLRAKAAPKLSERVCRNLRDLGFKQSQFEVRMSETDTARASGFDAVELLFSPNPGEPLKPMRAIASSGEISRLMLAIKSALVAQDAVPVLVFDEIDANVGGEIAHAVGARMRELAKRHQVLCITHLPPVAAAASSHFVVTKEVRGGRTFTQLREVSGKGRREEIARMLGGKSDEALKLAATMLDQQ